MKKTSKKSKASKGSGRREAPLSEAFKPMTLDGIASSDKQFSADGFKR